MSITAQAFVPEWYQKAKEQGDSETMLMEKMREVCLTALNHRASREGSAPVDDIEPGAVALVMEMYEAMLGKSKE